MFECILPERHRNLVHLLHNKSARSCVKLCKTSIGGCWQHFEKDTMNVL